MSINRITQIGSMATTELWTPVVVPGAVWLEGYDNNDFTFSSGSIIATWPNKYDTAQIWTPKGTGAPTFDSSNKMVVCNGANSLSHNRGFLSNTNDQKRGFASLAGTNGFYLYALIILRTSTVNGSTPHLSFGGTNFGSLSGNFFNLIGVSGNQVYIRVASDGGRTFIFSGFVTNTWMMWEVFVDARPYSSQIGTNTVKTAKDAATFQTYSTSTSGSLVNYVTNNISFGNNQGATYIPVDIKALYAAQLDINQADTYSTVEKIRGYFAHRFSLTSLLPGGHLYKVSPPTISTYNSLSSQLQNLFIPASRLAIHQSGKVTVADTDKVTTLRSDGALYSTSPGTPLDLTATGAARPTYNATNKYIEFAAGQFLKSTTMRSPDAQGSTFGIIAVVEFLSYGASPWFLVEYPGSTDICALTANSATTFRVYQGFTFSEFTVSSGALASKNIISIYEPDYSYVATGAAVFRINGIAQSRTTTNASGSIYALTSTFNFNYSIGAEVANTATMRLYDFLWVSSTDARAIEKYEYQLAVENNMLSTLDNSHPYKNTPPKY